LSFKKLLKGIGYSLFQQNRMVLLDYPGNLQASYSVKGKNPHQGLYQLINSNRKFYQQHLRQSLVWIEKFNDIQDEAGEDETKPHWNNQFFPPLDMLMQYSLLAQFKPSQYLEIGSGTSTTVAYKCRQEQSLNFSITAIDPSPRKQISKITDSLIKKNLQHTNLEIFKALQPNDVVFFDGTHLLFPNSDVMWFFLEVLPVLQKGVIIQVHDVYLPYDYPEFMLSRFYNEQYLLAALLLNHPQKFETLSPNFFISSDAELSSLLNPFFQLPQLKNKEQHGGSFWFRIM